MAESGGKIAELKKMLGNKYQEASKERFALN